MKNLMKKKYIFYLIFVNLIFFIFLIPSSVILAEAPPAKPSQTMNLNVPIGNITGGEVNIQLLGNYLAAWYNFLLGSVGIIATIVIMWGGFKWLSSRGDTKQISDAQDIIFSAIAGLIIAFGSFLIISLVNPNLTKINMPGLDDIKIMASQEYDTIGPDTEMPVSTGSRANRSNAPTPGGLTPGMSDFSSNLSETNQIRSIDINTQTLTATITDNNGNTIEIPINIGVNGTSDSQSAYAGDRKTPLGSYTLTEDQRIANNYPNETITVSGTNVGPAFLNTSISDANGNNRGIGIHGGALDSQGQLRPTYGCIRVSNENLSAIARHAKPGTVINIR